MKQGVPAEVRSRLWKKLLDVDTLKASKIFNYKVRSNTEGAKELAKTSVCVILFD